MIEKQTNVERSYNDAKQYGVDHGVYNAITLSRQ